MFVCFSFIVKLVVISLGSMSIGVCGSVDPQQLTVPVGGDLTSNRYIQPSNDLPISGLIESPDKLYDPKVEDIDTKIMLEKLGKNYDSRFMSWTRPSVNSTTANGTLELSLQRNRKGQWVPRGKMPEHIKLLKFKSWLAVSGGSSNSRFSAQLMRNVRQFLWSFTYCPVMHVWKDLGIRFWPRWLREGHCYSQQSCSIPSGMSCKPSKSEGKTVLRWHCEDWEKVNFCKWIPIKYPVVVQCNCSC